MDRHETALLNLSNKQYKIAQYICHIYILSYIYMTKKKITDTLKSKIKINLKHE